MKRVVELPLSFGQKLQEVLLQICLLPLSALVTLLALWPISLPFCGVIFDAIEEAQRAAEQSINTLPYALGYFAILLLSWVPYVYYPQLIEYIKGFNPKGGTHINVGASDTLVTKQVQRAVKDQYGTTVGYVEDTAYEVKHDDGGRYIESKDDELVKAIRWFGAPMALPLRCFSLLFSLFALLSPTLFVSFRDVNPAHRSSLGYLLLDLCGGSVFPHTSFVTYKEPELNFPEKNWETVTGIIMHCSFAGRGARISIEKKDYSDPYNRKIVEGESWTPNYVIANGAFANLRRVVSIDTPEDIIRIQSGSFVNCPFLSEVTLRVHTCCIIEPRAFSNCSVLEKVKMTKAYPMLEWKWEIFEEAAYRRNRETAEPIATYSRETLTAEQAAFLLLHTYNQCYWVFNQSQYRSYRPEPELEIKKRR